MNKREARPRIPYDADLDDVKAYLHARIIQLSDWMESAADRGRDRSLQTLAAQREEAWRLFSALVPAWKESSIDALLKEHAEICG